MHSRRARSRVLLARGLLMSHDNASDILRSSAPFRRVLSEVPRSRRAHRRLQAGGEWRPSFTALVPGPPCMYQSPLVYLVRGAEV
jgi:hypothetical protein